MRKNTLILLAVFVVLLLVVLVAENPFEGGWKKEKAPALFAAYDSAAVAVIEIYTPSDTTRLEKTTGIWRVATKAGYPADAKSVGDLVSKVGALEGGEIASRNPEKRSVYQVDGSVVEARISAADGKVLAHLFVGKNAPDFTSTYVRAEGSDEVIQARGYLRTVFDKGKRGWRDRTIVDVEQNEILRFSIERGDTVITVATEDRATWQITEPEISPAKASVVDPLLRTFSSLMADDFDPEISPEEAGLLEPWGRFTARLEDGTDVRLAVGKEEAGYRWVRRPERQMFFKVRTFRIKNLFKTLDDLREEVEEEPEETAEELQ